LTSFGLGIPPWPVLSGDADALTARSCRCSVLLGLGGSTPWRLQQRWRQGP
jgi:hypothetical protein